MTDDEALREALLEINHLRAREAAALREANALLRGVQRMNTAPSPGTALVELLHSVAATMRCECVAVVRNVNGDAHFHPTVGETMGRVLKGAGAQLTDKSRLVLDLALTTWWSATVGPYRSLVVVPIAMSGADAAILCLSGVPGAFTKADILLLTRLSELAAQALATHDLAARNALLAAVIDRAPIALTISDATRPDGPLIYVNDAYCAMTGYGRDEVIGRHCPFLSAEPAGSAEMTRLRQTITTGEVGRFEFASHHRDGSLFDTDVTVFPVEVAPGRRYLVASQIDTTERRGAERERDQTRHRMVAALSEASEGFLILDAQGLVVLANPPWRELYSGAPCGWTEGRAFVDIWADRLVVAGVPRAEAAARAGCRLEAMRGGRRDHQETLPDGRVVLLSETSFGGSQSVSIATDVTRLEHSKRELALRAAAIEAAQDGIAIIDEDGRFVYMNSAHLEMFGYAAHEVIGHSWMMLYADPDTERLRSTILPNLSRGGYWRGELIGRHKTGRKVDQELSLTRLSGSGMVCLTRDIGMRKRQEAENLRLREQLNAAQRQEAIGVIAAGVAHDFNNVIAAISGSATLLAEDDALAERERAHAGRILKASDRARNLVGRLLDFGKRRDRPERIDAAEVLAEASDLIAASVTGGLEVHLELPDEAVPVTIDATDFLQIVLNFVINARDAMGGAQGNITVELIAEATPETFGEVVIGNVRPGPYAALSVGDGGMGISPENFRSIFEPYVSSKGEGGTGLGLAVVAELTREAGGLIAIRSKVGRGTRITLFLPRTGELVARSTPWRASAREPDLTLDGRIILVIDDDQLAGEVTTAALERMGAEAALCCDPEDALEAVREDPEAWDALVTDYEMPGLDGRALAHAAHALRGDLPCVCVTGRRDVRQADSPFAAVLTKPVNPRDLAAALVAAVIRKERVLQ
ncbi:PAS domain S-box protein [Acuticoccus sp. I52.16.1]|uniref:PAS domain-containing sensor histidine kinase n=1 Tax=Acuticoccus sp. I52.16.1 TaxID=2928472 RepID=UPI001FCFDFC5|nr:PAS domain S-box protein [Acuticoccus sp. I52.16.1]UOM34649.1 PAS domain S-box protein [Acuticoccus sp. I52.16.1]